jgi:hypothetical protein
MQEMLFVLTATSRAGARVAFTGTITPAPGATRLAIYNQLITKLARDNGEDPSNYAPLFFSLEPNRLDAN